MVGKAAKTRKSTGSKSTGKAGKAERKVLYPEVAIKKCEGETALTASQGKELLGWQEETDKVKFGSTFLVTDLRGLKIRCTNNVSNRPIYISHVLALKQEILRGRWRMNGESMIIGRTGQILNGQHTLIALIFASQEVEQYPDRWPYWSTEPTIDKCIVFGIPEEDDVVNTMDTCKPRSLKDVIYRSPYFAHLSNKVRVLAANMAAFGVRMLWERTGASLDPHSPYRNHSEFLDLIERHPRLIKCVEHIYEEAKESKRFKDYISLGYATGLLYLMGSAATDPEEYAASTAPNEDLLDWALWDKACDFWVVFTAGGDQLKPLRDALAYLPDSDDEPGLSKDERCSLVANAWNLFANDKPVTTDAIKLKYETDPDGFKILAEFPTVGGVDVGKTKDVEESSPDKPSKVEKKKQEGKAKAKITKSGKPKKKRNGGRKPDKPAPTPEQIKARAKMERQKRDRKASSVVGKLMWVTGNGEPWRGKVMEATGANAKLRVAQGFQGAGNIVAVRIKDLAVKQPIAKGPTCSVCGGGDFYDDGSCRSCYQ